jgi:putative FmdB family regulatory protein
MPIYAYRCSNCGHAQDVLQRMSDPVLSVCPACGQPTYVKQVTAAGFQLKGSGWYVTDFRDGKKTAPAADADKAGAKDGDAAAPAGGEAAPAAEAGKGGDAAKKPDTAKKPDVAPSAPTAASPAPAAAPAPPSGKTAD